MTESERKALIAHDLIMQRPVRELFPPTGPRVTSVCRLCKKTYTRSAASGKCRGFCTDHCRDAWKEGRTARVHNPIPRIPQSNRKREAW